MRVNKKKRECYVKDWLFSLLYCCNRKLGM